MSIPNEIKRIVLAQRPTGDIDDSTFRIESLPTPVPAEGEVLIRVDLCSLDPTQRTWIKDVRSYVPPVQIGETMRAYALGTVVSEGKDFHIGDLVLGMFGWAEYVTHAEKSAFPLRKIPSIPGVPPVDFIGVLGATGMTAFFGTTKVAKVKAGQTLVVSGAAGATGAGVCQIGKIIGAKVIGLAGSAEKCEWLEKDLGIDKAYNYKDKDWRQRFEKEVGFLDVYFDNVGGETLDYFLTRMNQNARIVACGAISQYNATETYGLKNYVNIISMRAKYRGFLVTDFIPQFPEGVKQMGQWMREGKLKRKYHVEKGIENCPSAIQLLFNGGNDGKLIVQFSKEGEALQQAPVQK